jgi:hypothetical protein
MTEIITPFSNHMGSLLFKKNQRIEKNAVERLELIEKNIKYIQYLIDSNLFVEEDSFYEYEENIEEDSFYEYEETIEEELHDVFKIPEEDTGYSSWDDLDEDNGKIYCYNYDSDDYNDYF